MPDQPTPSEKPEGSLIFESAEQAREFSERVGRRLEGVEEAGEGAVDARVRGAIREELEAETRHLRPEPVEVRAGEWTYSAQDYQEIQRAVELAFEKSITDVVHAWLKQARERGVDKATVYKRLDLLHDTLTDTLYPVMKERGLLPRFPQ